MLSNPAKEVPALNYIRGGQPAACIVPPLPEPQNVCEVGRNIDRRHGPIVHSIWALDNIIQGDYQLEVAGQSWLRGENTVLLYPPGTEYYEGPGSSSFVVSRYVVFGPERFPPLEELLAGSPYLAFEDPGGIISGLLEKMVTLAEVDGSAFGILGLMMELIQYLLCSSPLDDGKRLIVPFASRAQSQFVAKVNRILQGNLDLRLNLEEVAKKLHVSPSTLAHRYKEETGISPYKARTSYRLQMAQELLRYQDKTLEEIAHEVGFASASHLSGAFKKKFGCSPSRYREKLQGKR